MFWNEKLVQQQQSKWKLSPYSSALKYGDQRSE